jgi:hypothetical protein
MIQDGNNDNREKIDEEIIYLQEKINQLNFHNIHMNEDLAKSLIGAFEQLILDLRKDIENNTPILLQQIYGELYGESTIFPTKAIVEFRPDASSAKQNRMSRGTKIEIKKMYFSALEELNIWPVCIYAFQLIPSANFSDRENSLPTNSSHLLKILLKPLSIPFKGLPIDELRFFIHGKNGESMIANLFMREKIFTVYTGDSRDRNIPNWYKTATIQYNIPEISDGIEIIKDYVSLPEIYQFFTIKDFDFSNIFEDLVIYIPVNIYSSDMNFDIRLFNYIFVNKFATTTYPMIIDLRETAQKITLNNFDKNVKIYSIENIKNVIDGTYLTSWHSYKQGENTFISFLSKDGNIIGQNGLKVYGEVIVHNGENTNFIKVGDDIKVTSNQNIKGFIQHINSYNEVEENIDVLHNYLNTDFKLLLNDISLFKKHINNLLLMFANSYNLSIEEIQVENRVEITRWNQCPVPIPTKLAKITLKTNKQEIWIFLNLLSYFINRLSFVQQKVILSTVWKGFTYVIQQ